MDITMCKARGCPIKRKCKRYTAIPDSQYQSYFLKVPFDKIKKECEYFWDNKK